MPKELRKQESVAVSSGTLLNMLIFPPIQKHGSIGLFPEKLVSENLLCGQETCIRGAGAETA